MAYLYAVFCSALKAMFVILFVCIVLFILLMTDAIYLISSTQGYHPFIAKGRTKVIYFSKLPHI